MTNDELLDYTIFDFAFSFVGEDREVVEEIYNKLKSKGYNVFYDNAYHTQLVGRDLYTGLRELYKNKGKYIVCFISENYAKKVWTSLEFTAIKERLMSTFFAGDFLIPILIENAQLLDDIPSYIGFYRHESVDKTVQMLDEKISVSTIEDNFLLNINGFIIYLCNHVFKALSNKNPQINLINNNKISISGSMGAKSLVFYPDPDAQAPCILVRRESFYPDNKNLLDEFPVFIITWRKQKQLYFSIHEFDSRTDNLLEKLLFHDVVNYICAYLQEGIGGIEA